MLETLAICGALIYLAQSSGAQELDPEWLYWVLGVVVTGIVGAVELLRSRPVGVAELLDLQRSIGELATRITALESRMPEELGERLGRLEGATPEKIGERLAVIEHVFSTMQTESDGDGSASDGAHGDGA